MAIGKLTCVLVLVSIVLTMLCYAEYVHAYNNYNVLIKFSVINYLSFKVLIIFFIGVGK